MTDEQYEIPEVPDEDRRLLELEAAVQLATVTFRPSPPRQPSHPVQNESEQPQSQTGLYMLTGGVLATGILIVVVLMRRKLKTEHDGRGNT